jgi:copper homeostasis protein (lipoprotein)
MKKQHILLLAIVTFFTIFTHAQKSKPSPAKTSLDWAGIYSGIVPAANGSIETELKLNDNGTYTLTTTHSKATKPTAITGKFNWSGNNIILAGIPKGTQPNMYKVEENRVRQLDMKGNEIKSKLSHQYLLTKNGNAAVEDKKWKLIELNGKAIEGNENTHYVIFHSKDGMIEAKAGCNQLRFPYKIKNQLQVQAKQGISTLMACPDKEEIEKQFIAAVTMANNLSVANNKLSLNKAKMAPLAVFELVN